MYWNVKPGCKAELSGLAAGNLSDMIVDLSVMAWIQFSFLSLSKFSCSKFKTGILSAPL